MVFDDERQARQVSEAREAIERDNELKTRKATSLDSMFKDHGTNDKTLNLVLKGDVQGSIEALKGMLAEINVDGFTANVVRSAVGPITESDVSLAAASNAVVIGFNVRPPANVRALAENEGVEIRLYNVVYRITEDIEKALKGMLEPTFEEVITGQAVVRETFKVSKIGTIAGAYVTDGFIKRDALVRVIREGIVIYEGELSSLKRFKDDVKEVRTGYECGLSIHNYNDIKVDDIIEASTLQQVEEK
jgi:translation initiation factor IF-2